MTITKEQLLNVGNEVASIYGAVCVGYHLDKNNEVVFECNECGDEFETTPMSLAEIVKEYNYCL